MIPKIKEIGGEAHVLPLPDGEVFDEREIPILLERPAINIAPEVAKAGCAEVRIRSALVRIQQRRSRECSRIQPSIQAISHAAVTLTFGNGRARRQARADRRGDVRVVVRWEPRSESGKTEPRRASFRCKALHR